jgi:hypothetical protein
MPFGDDDSPISANTIRLILVTTLFFVAAFVVIPFIFEAMGYEVTRCVGDTIPCGVSSHTSIQIKDKQ